MNTFYISISELLISSKELNPSCTKENCEKEGRKIAPFTLEALNSSGS